MISIPKIIRFQARHRLFISGFLSIFTHIILFSTINRSVHIDTKGEKIIPIEVLIDESKVGYGKSLKKPVKKNLKPIENSSKSRNNNSDRELKKIEDRKSIVNNEKEKKTPIPNKPDNTKIINDQSKMGSEKNSNENNIPEKGSVKGKGKIKITCLDCKSPRYPPKALRRGAEGSPLIKVWINTKGDVVKSIIVRSSSINSIDEAAIKAATESKFYPIQSDSTLNIEYNLKIR